MAGRPKTAASTYIPTTFRIPPDLLARVHRLIGTSGIPLNTKLGHLLRLGVEAEEQSHPQEEKHLVGSRED